MSRYATTRLSSRGQVVIPEDIRNHLGLKEGDHFVVIGEGDAIVLKAIPPPKPEEFEALVARADHALAARRPWLKKMA